MLSKKEIKEYSKEFMIFLAISLKHSCKEDSLPLPHIGIFAELVITGFRANMGRPKQPIIADSMPLKYHGP